MVILCEELRGDSMFTKEFDEITLADLQTLVDDRISEGRQLEFKRDHYGRKDEDKREFAADVSAFANSYGGYLLVGVDENNGIASNLCGITGPDPDGLVRSVSESIRTSFEPPLVDFRLKWITVESERGVLLIKIARSWNAPHRVVVANSKLFFIRDENGKHSMSVDELRRAFLFASEVEEKIRRFRSDRLEILSNNEGPLAVGDDGDARLVLHVVPRASLTDSIQLSFDSRGTVSWPWPLGRGSGGNSMFSLDGLVCYSGLEGQTDSARAFSTLFRNGISEGVAKVHIGQKDGRRTVSLTDIELYVINGLCQILVEYKTRSVSAPYTVIISLLGMKGAAAPTSEWRGGIAYPYRSDRVMLPELVIDAAATSVAPEIFLRPLFDLLWNAFGQFGSPNYNQLGKYTQL